MGPPEEPGFREDEAARHALDLVGALPAVVWEADGIDQHMLYVSPRARDILGVDPETMLREPQFWETHIHPDDLVEASTAVADAIISGDAIRIEYRFRTGDGTYRWFSDSIQVLAGEDGSRRLAGVMLDITGERHRELDDLAASRAVAATGAGPSGVLSAPLHKLVVDNLSDGVYYVDAERRITYWNHGAERITGLAAADALGRRCSDDFLSCVDAEGRVLCGSCPLSTALHDGRERQQVLWLRHARGHRVPVLIHVNPIRDDAGTSVIGAVETFSDATGLLQAQGMLAGPAADAFADPVTGLADRRLLHAVLTARKDDLDRYRLPFGLMLVEIDHLPQLTAEQGTTVADQVRATVAATLRGTLRAGDIVVRWSASDFAIAVAFVDSVGMERLADRLLHLVRATRVAAPGGPVDVSVSIGGAIARRAERLERLYGRAEQAVAAARVGGHDRVMLSDPIEATASARTLGVRSARQGGPGQPTSPAA